LDNPRPEKVAVVDEVRERLDGSSAAILTEYRGLTVKEIADLRQALRQAGATYGIYKNTLVRFAVRDLGANELEEMLTGPTAIAFVDGDAAAVAKALQDFAKTNPNLVIKGGLLGTSILSPADTKALAELPSREVLLARLAGGLAAPLQKMAGLLQALPRNMAYGLAALIEQKGGAPEAPAEAPEADAPAEEAIAEAPADATADATETEAAADAPEADAPAETTETTDAEAPVAEAATDTETTAEAPAEAEDN
jgi:large subunit ribosomal protein L10